MLSSSIMLRNRFALILAGLMCLSSVGRFSTVVCHGSDGHITIEPVLHSHCDCPESAEPHPERGITGYAMGSSHDQWHCTDSVIASTYFVSVKKNVRPLSHTTFVPHSVTDSNSTAASSLPGRRGMPIEAPSPFHLPLQTVILLA